MNLPQIKPELLNEWKKKGEILIIWRCERCYKKSVFYKSDMPLINGISLAWAHNHKYCQQCEKKMNGITIKKKVKVLRINRLLEKYEPPEEDWLYA